MPAVDLVQRVLGRRIRRLGVAAPIESGGELVRSKERLHAIGERERVGGAHEVRVETHGVEVEVRRHFVR